VQIEITEPELLNDLCDYLSRHGIVAVAASRERANVLVPTAGYGTCSSRLRERVNLASPAETPRCN